MLNVVLERHFQNGTPFKLLLCPYTSIGTSLTSPLAHVLFHRTPTRVLEDFQDLKDLHTEKKEIYY